MPFQKHAVPHGQKNAACLQFNVLREARPSAFKETRISDTPRDYTRSASHISGLLIENWRFSRKAKYARLRTLPRVGCPSGACSSRRAPLPERPAAQGAATGLCLFQSMPAFSPDAPCHFRLARERGVWYPVDAPRKGSPRQRNCRKVPTPPGVTTNKASWPRQQ